MTCHWRIQGGAAARAPPIGSISFVFTYVFAEKCVRRRLAPHQRVGNPPPPNGKSWIRHCLHICRHVSIYPCGSKFLYFKQFGRQNGLSHDPPLFLPKTPTLPHFKEIGSVLKLLLFYLQNENQGSDIDRRICGD